MPSTLTGALSLGAKYSTTEPIVIAKYQRKAKMCCFQQCLVVIQRGAKNFVNNIPGILFILRFDCLRGLGDQAESSIP